MLPEKKMSSSGDIGKEKGFKMLVFRFLPIWYPGNGPIKVTKALFGFQRNIWSSRVNLRLLIRFLIGRKLFISSKLVKVVNLVPVGMILTNGSNIKLLYIVATLKLTVFLRYALFVTFRFILNPYLKDPVPGSLGRIKLLHSKKLRDGLLRIVFKRFKLGSDKVRSCFTRL